MTPAAALQVNADFDAYTSVASIDEAVALARRTVEDLTFPTVRTWRESGGRVVGSFPVYTPHELVHSLGLLPVALHGGGEGLDITKADAALGSFLCSVSKSTLELALTGRLDGFDALVFPYICDVSRNLEGVMSRRLPTKTTHMLHLPQNFHSKATVPFLVAEYKRLLAKLEPVAGRAFDRGRLSASLKLFNEHRALVRRLTEIKRDEPWKLSLEEYYLLVRLGGLLPREIHMRMLETVLRELPNRNRKERDAVRVVVVGPFCEQPTLDLLKLVEDAGCYVVDDDLQMLHRWVPKVPASRDPLTSLAQAYVDAPVDIGVRMTPTTKAEAILRRVEAARAQGVVFLTAKFCEPALEDFVLYERALSAHGIPSLQLEFEEKSSGFDQSRLALETFVESILFD